MNMPSSTRVGTSSTNASQRSSSSNRCRRGGGASRSVVAETALIAMLDPRRPEDSLAPHEKWEGDGLTSDVDLLELSLCPLHGILGGHALDGLCVHINDDVLGDDLGCLARRGSLVASEAARARRLLVGQHNRVVAPQLVLFPIRGRADREALLGDEPFVVDVLPERHHELPRLDRCWAVQHNCLAVCFDLFAAPGPQVRVSEGGRIAEGVAQRLSDGPSLCLQLLAGLAILFPGLGKFSIRVADLGKPGLSVCDLQADDAPRHCDPFLAVIGDSAGCFVEAALAFAEFLSEVADVCDALAVKLPPIVEDANDVGACPRLDRRSDAGLDIVGVDGFDIELYAERLLALLGDFVAQKLI